MNSARVYNQLHTPAKIHLRQAALQRLLDLELSVGSQPGCDGDGQSLLHDDGGAPRGVARLRRTEEFSEKMFLQGIAGTLELFHLSIVSFQKVVGRLTGQPVSVFQRIDQAGQRLPLDERVLADTDTLMVFGLDHLVTEQEASPEEIEAVRHFLAPRRNLPGSWSAPRRGRSDDLKVRAMEYAHHGDPLVPRQQRFSKYTRSLMKGLGVPVENR